MKTKLITKHELDDIEEYDVRTNYSKAVYLKAMKGRVCVVSTVEKDKETAYENLAKILERKRI